MNNIIYYHTPAWIAQLFMLAIPLPFILIVLFVRKVGAAIGLLDTYKNVALFLLAYVAYVALASYLHWFDAATLPPRVLLLTTFPYAVIIFAAAMYTKQLSAIIRNATMSSLIGLHIFRLVGIFFILLAVHNALPKAFAFIAGIGDVLAAVSSIYVVSTIKQQKPFAKKLALAWNIFGAIDILFTAIAANVLTKLALDSGSMGVDTLARFPFCIIPAFAPPTILLLHFIIFKKLKNHNFNH